MPTCHQLKVTDLFHLICLGAGRQGITVSPFDIPLLRLYVLGEELNVSYSCIHSILFDMIFKNKHRLPQKESAVCYHPVSPQPNARIYQLRMDGWMDGLGLGEVTGTVPLCVLQEDTGYTKARWVIRP